MDETINTRLPDPAIPILLKGQTALVTGANSGIGRAVAIALGKADANVAVNYVADEDATQEVVNAIAAAGSRALAPRVGSVNVAQSAAISGARNNRGHAALLR